MATETLPASAALSLENFVWSSSAQILSATSEAALFGKERLLDYQRSRTHRSVTNGQHKIRIDLGSSRQVDVLGLIDSNLASGQSAILWGADNIGDLGGTSGTGVKHTLSAYGGPYPATLSSLLRWYLGANDAGTSTGASRTKRYWEVELPLGGTAALYHELSCVWLGAYVALAIDTGSGRSMQDPSPITRLPGGATYVDPVRTGRTARVSDKYKTRDSAVAMEAAIVAVGAKRPVLIDQHANTTTTAVKLAAPMYGRLEGLEIAASFAALDDIAIRFREEVA